MGPTLKSLLYKGDFSMYLDMILVPYFRLSSIFLYFLYFTHSFIFTKFRFRPTTVRRTPTTHTPRTSTFTHALLTTLFLLHILIPSFLGIFSLLSCFRTWQLVGSYSGDLLDVHITPRRDGLADYPPHPYHTRSRARCTAVGAAGNGIGNIVLFK